MSQARTLALRFYTAFAARDAEAMAACYADDATFSDPVFPELRGEAVRDMWRMLCARGKDLRVQHELLEADATHALVRWHAWYSFTGTGRSVHNVVMSRLELRDGKIVTHRDRFNFHRWARQALGPPGLLLGWAPFLRRKVQQQAAVALARFCEQRETGG